MKPCQAFQDRFLIFNSIQIHLVVPEIKSVNEWSKPVHCVGSQTTPKVLSGIHTHTKAISQTFLLRIKEREQRPEQFLGKEDRMHSAWGSSCLLPHYMTKCIQHKIFTVNSGRKFCMKHFQPYNIKIAWACLVFKC
jgi:hypothetical protein